MEQILVELSGSGVLRPCSASCSRLRVHRDRDRQDWTLNFYRSLSLASHPHKRFFYFFYVRPKKVFFYMEQIKGVQHPAALYASCSSSSCTCTRLIGCPLTANSPQNNCQHNKSSLRREPKEQNYLRHPQLTNSPVAARPGVENPGTNPDKHGKTTEQKQHTTNT